MRKLLIVLILTALPLFGCVPELTNEGPQADGIVIYTGSGVILNGRENVEIVAKRTQQLNATTPSGGVVEWKSSNPAIVEVVDQTGLIRVGQALGKTATITASLREKPEIKAEVTFIVRDLR